MVGNPLKFLGGLLAKAESEEQAAARRADAAREAYERLVREIAAGAEPSESKILAVITAAGVTVRDLNADVAGVIERQRLAALMNDRPKHAAAINDLEAEIAAATKAEDHRRQQFHDTVNAIRAKQDEHSRLINEGVAAENRLARMASPQLKAEIAEARNAVAQASDFLERTRQSRLNLEADERAFAAWQATPTRFDNDPDHVRLETQKRLSMEHRRNQFNEQLKRAEDGYAAAVARAEAIEANQFEV